MFETSSKDQYSPNSAPEVPHWDLLDDYGWIDGYHKAEELRPQVEHLESERAEIQRQPLPIKERLANLRPHFEAYQQRRVDALALHFRTWDGRGDPMRYVKTHQLAPAALLPPYFSWDEVERAFSTLPDAGMPAAEQQRKLAKIDDKLRALRAEYDRLSEGFLIGKNGADIRVEFVRHWEGTQSRVDGPADPRGRTLEYSDEAERRAWKKLGLKEAIDKNAPERPYAAYPVE